MLLSIEWIFQTITRCPLTERTCRDHHPHTPPTAVQFSSDTFYKKPAAESAEGNQAAEALLLKSCQQCVFCTVPVKSPCKKRESEMETIFSPHWGGKGFVSPNIVPRSSEYNRIKGKRKVPHQPAGESDTKIFNLFVEARTIRPLAACYSGMCPYS